MGLTALTILPVFAIKPIESLGLALYAGNGEPVLWNTGNDGHGATYDFYDCRV